MLILVCLLQITVFADEFPTDPPPCPGEGCDPDEWVMKDISYSNFIECEGCTIVVWVKINRQCNEMYLQYYQIASIECVECLNDASWTWEDINRLINIRLLTQGPLTPPGTETEVVITLSEQACWQPGGGGPNPYQWQPCPTPTCCKRTYRVTRNKYNQVFYSFQGGETVGPPCELPCGEVCEIENWWPSIVLLENKEPENIVSFIKSSIIPNPNSGQAVINYYCKENGIVKFILTDVKGNTVLNLNTQKSSPEGQITLDLKTINSGQYYYNLIINKMTISTGSIIVSK